jgi:hypothetical protein
VIRQPRSGKLRGKPITTVASTIDQTRQLSHSRPSSSPAHNQVRILAGLASQEIPGHRIILVDEASASSPGTRSTGRQPQRRAVLSRRDRLIRKVVRECVAKPAVSLACRRRGDEAPTC